MATANPYTPPRAAVADIESSGDSFQEVRIWSASGRIGRLRYLAYTTAGSLLIGLLAGIATAVLGPTLGGTVALLAYIPLLVFAVMTMIQRSHDMDWSGWMCLLGIIPFVGLIWLFKSGTEGENRFGAPPPPNTTGVKILGFALPLIAVVGILAAIALPAYQQYVMRGQAAQQSE